MKKPMQSHAFTNLNQVGSSLLCAAVLLSLSACQPSTGGESTETTEAVSAAARPSTTATESPVAGAVAGSTVAPAEEVSPTAGAGEHRDTNLAIANAKQAEVQAPSVALPSDPTPLSPAHSSTGGSAGKIAAAPVSATSSSPPVVDALQPGKTAVSGTLSEAKRLEVLGLTLGMAPKRAAEIVKSFKSKQKILYQGFDTRLSVPSNVNKPEYPTGYVIRLIARSPQALLQLEFTHPPDANRLVRLSRTHGSSTGGDLPGTSQDVYVRALVTKYGKPAVQTDGRGISSAKPTRLLWKAHKNDAECAGTLLHAPGSREEKISKLCDAVLEVNLTVKNGIVESARTTLRAPREFYQSKERSKAHFAALKKENENKREGSANAAPEL